MCWSKGSSESDRYTGTTPTSSLFSTSPMGDTVLQCPSRYILCTAPGFDKSFCMDNGICCNNTAHPFNRICQCNSGYDGRYCENTKVDVEYSKELMERTKAIVTFSAILGVVVIAFFVAIIVLQIKYYRRRKQRRQKVIDQEMHKASQKADENGSSRRHPTTQPGYSWRESVRGRRSVLQKLKSSVSRSVPEDLFKVGLKLAAFGVGDCGAKSKSEDNPLSHLFGHNGATVDIESKATTVRYFSDSGAGMACPEDTSTILNDEKEKDCVTKPTTITIAAITAQTSPAIEQEIHLKVDED